MLLAPVPNSDSSLILPPDQAAHSVSQPARRMAAHQGLSDIFVFHIWFDLWGADFSLEILCDKSQLFIPTWWQGRIFSYESYGKICLVSAVGQNLGFC